MTTTGDLAPHLVAAVQRMRLRLLAAVGRAQRGGRIDAVEFPGDRSEAVAWLDRRLSALRPRELRGASQWGIGVADFYPYHRELVGLVDRGVRVSMVVDHGQAAAYEGGAGVEFLTAADDFDYQLGYVDGDAWLVNGRHAVVDLPRGANGGVAWVATTDPDVIATVLAYLDAVAATARRARNSQRDDGELTQVHHVITSMLDKGWPDGRISEVLGVTRRTVQNRINELYDFHGVSTRYMLAKAQAGRQSVRR